MKADKDISVLMDKARKSILGADILFREDLYDFSASRSYYAMFYATEAALLTKSLSFSSHKAVISAFGKEFIKSGTLPSFLHRNIRDAFRLRQAGDYGTSASVSKEESQTLIAQAKEFIDTIEAYLKN
jgi:uncharacterized protein (UPF0332 family)